jgi:Uma2 family endonuclease
MTLAVDEKKEFRVGTLGWTASDLDDAVYERQWLQGSYEIVEGVLTEMPPADFDGGIPLFKLGSILTSHVERKKLGGSFASETDIVLDERRVVRADIVYLTNQQMERQAALYAEKPKRRRQVRYGRLLIPPMLVIEGVSIGHEAHDRETKFEWYAEAGVKHYWLLYHFRRSIECYELGRNGYRLADSAQGNAKLKSSLFPGLVIPLAKLWK